jgi:hypothetical protein
LETRLVVFLVEVELGEGLPGLWVDLYENLLVGKESCGPVSDEIHSRSRNFGGDFEAVGGCRHDVVEGCFVDSRRGCDVVKGDFVPVYVAVGRAIDCVGCAVECGGGIGSAEIGIEVIVFVVGDDAGSEIFGSATVSPIHSVGTGSRQREEVGFRVDCVKAHEFGFAGTDCGEGKPGRVAYPGCGCGRCG